MEGSWQRGYNPKAGRPIERAPHSLLVPGYRLGLHRLQHYLPSLLRRETFLPGRFPPIPFSLHVHSERGIDSHPAGWMAPTSCPGNLGCLPRWLSDSTISQQHPGTHQTSRKKKMMFYKNKRMQLELMVTLAALHTMKPWTLFMTSGVQELGTSSGSQDKQSIDR